MTQRLLIEDILLKSEGGRISDDHLIDYDQVRLWTNQWRARFIKEFVEKRQLISTDFAQDLGCIDLVCVDKADCCDGSMVYENYKKLAIELPTLIDLGGYSAVTFIGLIDKVTKINMVDPYYAQYAQHSKFTGKQRHVFGIGSQLYFILPKGDRLSKVNVRAILFDPREVNNFVSCGACYDEDTSKYPIAAYMNQLIIQSIMEKDLGFELKTEGINDRANDSMDTKVSNLK